MDTLAALIKTSFEAGLAEGLRVTGAHSGEITQREALRTYGSYFRNAVADGRLKPSRLGHGDRPCKWFRVSDILQLKARDEAAAHLLKIQNNIIK